ncbi:uncharacterized protein [Nicotiana sylvestris]|uniref:uncharacterized protein n=1 Tax=Nicotiana sylvestris TaxID=4096 RepID=UPI00388CB42E
MQFTLTESVRGVCPQLVQIEGPSRDMFMREEASSVPTPHLLDESSNRDESLPRKRRRMELGKDVVMDADRNPLCVAPKSEMLRAMGDMELSQNVADMDLWTLIMETECERRERKRTAIYGKTSSKYQQYRAKHRAKADIYNQDPDFQLFREGLKLREDQLERKVEELRERDEELMKAIARNSELEASLKVKEDELELSVKIEGLKGELSVGADKLATAISGTAALENTLRVCRLELTEEKEASKLKVAGLEGRVKELEAELSVLNGQVSSLRTEDASRRSQPSMSREAYGYNPLTPDEDDINSDDANRLASDSWYKDAYPTGDGV